MAARVLSLLCSFAVFGAVFCNYENTNKAYYRTYLANQRVYAYYNRILTRLEEQEGFSYDQDVMLAGGYKPETLSQRDIDGALIDDWEGMTRESGLVTQVREHSKFDRVPDYAIVPGYRLHPKDFRVLGCKAV